MGQDRSAIDFPKIPGYKIVGVLGEGGMGRVYEAEQVNLGRPVAIKAFHFSGSDEDFRFFHDRFLAEARALASMEEHENIVQVYDLIEAGGGNHYIVMQRVDGRSLENVLGPSGIIGVDKALDIAAQAAHALHHAHRHGIIHRDVKPANIMITGRGRVKVMDFGLARTDLATTKTQAGIALGTPDYMSPEHVDPKAKCDARSDVYSLATVLYRLLAGRPPFQDASFYGLVDKIRLLPPPPLRGLRPEISPEVENIVLKALAKKPDDRPRTAEEFALALEGARSEISSSGIPRRSTGALLPPSPAGEPMAAELPESPAAPAPAIRVPSALDAYARKAEEAIAQAKAGNYEPLIKTLLPACVVLGTLLALWVFVTGGNSGAAGTPLATPALPGAMGGPAGGDAVTRAEDMFERAWMADALAEAERLAPSHSRAALLRDAIEATINGTKALESGDYLGARELVDGAPSEYASAKPLAELRQRVERETEFRARQIYADAEASSRAGRRKAAREGFAMAEMLKPGYAGSAGPAADLAQAERVSETAEAALSRLDALYNAHKYGEANVLLGEALAEFERLKSPPLPLSPASQLRTLLESHRRFAGMLKKFQEGDAASALEIAKTIAPDMAVRLDVAARAETMERVDSLAREAAEKQSLELAQMALRLVPDNSNEYHRRMAALAEELSRAGREQGAALLDEGQQLANAGRFEEALAVYMRGRRLDPKNEQLAKAHADTATSILREAHRLGTKTEEERAKKLRLYTAVADNSMEGDKVREQALNQIQRLGLAGTWK
jgi:hypothetical protein